MAYACNSIWHMLTIPSDHCLARLAYWQALGQWETLSKNNRVDSTWGTWMIFLGVWWLPGNQYFKSMPPLFHFTFHNSPLDWMALVPPFPQTEARDGEVNTASISCCSELAQIHVSAQLSECLQKTRKLALLGLADIPLQWNFLCCRTYSQRHAVCRFCFYSLSFPWTGLDWATVRNGAWKCCQRHQLQSRHPEWFTVWEKKMPTVACERVQCQRLWIMLATWWDIFLVPWQRS